MRIREPRAGWAWFLWLWGAGFGGIPLVMLVSGATSTTGEPPVLFLLLFPAIAAAVLVPVVRRTLRAGFHLETDGIHGAHDAEASVVPWAEVERIEWRWAEETSGVTVNDRPLPDGYALHALLRDGRVVRLMQRVAPRYGQQQDLNQQLARAQAAGAVPVPFDATIPTHGEGEWSGTPPSRAHTGRSHTDWTSADLPPALKSSLAFAADDRAVGPRSAGPPDDRSEPRDHDPPSWPSR